MPRAALMQLRIEVLGTSLAYLDTGAPRPPIVLIHGNSASTAAWSPLMSGPLAERWRLVALDLPGCGDSGRSPSYSFFTLRDTILEFARKTRCEDGVFVGHSLGGHLVLEAAPRLARARGFAIFGAPPIGRPPLLDQAFLPTPALGAALKAELTDEEIAAWVHTMVAPGNPIPVQLVPDIRRTDPRLRSGIQEGLAGLAYTDEVEVVRTLGRPIAILHGLSEGIANTAYIEKLSIPTLWRGAVQSIEGAGHYPQLERPEAFSTLLGEFVETVLAP
jgi:pimeloyl-ACP methyl ester carboxylesterase